MIGVYQKLIGYRHMTGCIQKDFAKLIGVSVTSYQAKESGKTPFTDREKKRIREFIQTKLGKTLTIDELFF